MLKVVTSEEMREIDRLTTERYGIPSILLMENAANAAARVIAEKLGGSVKGKSFLILCGKGNNGGDGAALARILWTQGASVQVNLLGKLEETKGDARINFEICKNIYDKIDKGIRLLFFEYQGNNWINEIYAGGGRIVIDALFGTGLSRSIKGQIKEFVEKVNSYKNPYSSKNPYFKLQYLISLDIPSGLDSNLSDRIGENIQAHITITFTAPKLANLLPPASNYNGELVVANIGSPQELIDNSPSKLFVAEKQDAQDWLNQTEYTSDSYKNKRGHALLIVGSKEYTGAAVLSGNAAMLSGVGLTTIATSESAREAIAAKILEEIIVRGLPETKNGTVAKKAFAEVEKLIEKVDVVGIGCGLTSTEKTTRDFVREVVENRKTPVVIDADGLNALSPFELKGNDELPLILTPHEGEFLRLLGTKDKDAIKDRVKAMRDFAEAHEVILVLKGERVLIAAPDGRVVINPTGNSGLGKAGNGDTLTGIITGFVAQAVQMKVDIFETVVAAIYISSLAGDIAAAKFGKRTMLASDVRECLGEAFESMSELTITNYE
ncbi:MAG: NAD(P)H-hydrate dehydratase [Pyrinomonadaceae bacterium]